MNGLSKVTQIVHEWEYEDGKEPNWDDLREHDNEDLMSKYCLPRDAASLLGYIIKEETDHRFNAYGLEDKFAPIVLENIQESLHQSLDGWTDEQKIIIRAYLADLAYATHLTDEHRTENQIYTYVIYKSQYMYDEGPKMYEYSGTWRNLLIHLHSITDDEVHEWANGQTEEYTRRVPDEELKRLFDEMNGDGMSYYHVYNVEAKQTVID